MYMSKYPICNIQVQIRIKCTVKPKKQNERSKTNMNKDGFFCCTESDGSIPVKKKAGYAYVPFQRLGKLYDPETAMRAGTVFPELNLTLDEYERGLYNGV